MMYGYLAKFSFYGSTLTVNLQSSTTMKLNISAQVDCSIRNILLLTTIVYGSHVHCWGGCS